MTPVPANVLIVDDDLDTCVVTSMLLRREGYRVTYATSVREALDLAFDGTFDVILLDNWMPEMSGVEVCRELRSHEVKTPIIFQSAAAYSTDKEEAESAGAQDYLVKPVDHQDLLTALRTATNLSYSASTSN